MVTEVQLRDGTRALIRKLQPSDREGIREGYELLSPETRNNRFLANVPHLTDEMLDHLVDEVDQIDHVALALFVVDAGNMGEPVGVARMIRYADLPTSADLAVTVIDKWHGRGVATALLDELVRVRPKGVTQISTTIARDNPASLAMLRRLGTTSVTPAGGNRLDVVVELPEDPPTSTKATSPDESDSSEGPANAES